MAGSYRYVVCDVFTDRPLEGNQLGVFTDARGLSDEQMQRLARELNYSESTFVHTSWLTTFWPTLVLLLTVLALNLLGEGFREALDPRARRG